MDFAFFHWLFGVLFVAGFGFSIWRAIQQGKQGRANLIKLADALGLNVNREPSSNGFLSDALRANGTRRGRYLQVFGFSTGSGKSRTQWSAVSAVAPAAGGLTFHLRRQGFSTKFMEIFGAKEIVVGDVEFDRAWFIQTNQPETFGAALLPELREKITAFLRDAGNQVRGMAFKLESNEVRYVEIGNFADDKRCQRCLVAADIVGDLAEAADVLGQQPTGR